MSRLQQVVGGHPTTAGLDAEPRERTEDDLSERVEPAEDQRERADIEDLLKEATDDIVLAAKRPEQAGKRDVDADQHRRQEGDIAVQQPEPAVDVADEG